VTYRPSLATTVALVPRSGHLAAPSERELDIVDLDAERNLRKGQRVARLEGGVGTAHERGADLQPFGGQDVALLPILVHDQSDEGAAVRIILDRAHPARDADLVTPEIDLAIGALVPAALCAGR